MKLTSSTFIGDPWDDFQPDQCESDRAFQLGVQISTVFISILALICICMYISIFQSI